MATSGTVAFNLEIHEIIEEAYENCGMDLQKMSAQRLSTARRSLDLLLQEWNNDSVNLWTLEQSTQSLSSGANSYSLAADTIDVLDAVIRDSSSIDFPLHRMSIQEYLDVPNKTQEGKPTSYAVQRGVSTPTLYVWPDPPTSPVYTLVYYRIRQIQDSGVYSNNPDVPRRFLPALVYGLSYKLALKHPPKYEIGNDGRKVQFDGVDPSHRDFLKMEYMGVFQAAKDADRERTSLYAIPSVGRR